MADWTGSHQVAEQQADRGDGEGEFISLTVEDWEIEGVDIVTGLKVMPEVVSGGVDVGARVDVKLHHGSVPLRPVLHALLEPQELPHSLTGSKRRHALVEPVADVDDPPSVVDLPPLRRRHLAGVQAAVLGGAVVGRMRRQRGGGARRSEQREDEEDEYEDSHDGCRALRASWGCFFNGHRIGLRNR